MRYPPLLVSLLRLWEAVQVELHGRYSIDRLESLVDFSKTSTRLGNMTVLLLTPMPSLLLVLFYDALPLHSPHLGLSQQTGWLFVRLYSIASFATMTFTLQIHESSPTLPLSRARLAFVSLTAPLLAVIAFCLLGTWWVFPTPFVFHLIAGPWVVSAVGLVWWAWRPSLQSNREAAVRLTRYLRTVVVQATLMTGYLGYYTVFTLVGKRYQMYVSICLPAMKLFFKNAARSGLVYMEDLAPTTIVFNVDAFHAIFVSTVMQQADGQFTLGFILLVDLAQSIIAHHEVYSIVVSVRLAAKSANKNLESNKDSLALSLQQPKFNTIDHALYLTRTHPQIRERLAFVPSHTHLEATRESRRNFRPAASIPSAFLSKTLHQPSKVSPEEVRVPTITSRTQSERTLQHLPNPTNAAEHIKIESSHLRSVFSVLQMAYMIEFYVLIEFVEVAVATVYALYVQTMTLMCNRAYYRQFGSLTDSELRGTAKFLMVYAAFELLSFILFCIAIDRHLAHFSTLQQLAFVLRKHWKIVVPTLAMWIVVVQQYSFQHFGIDYTFQFEWVRVKNATLRGLRDSIEG